ncbi:glycoside hydrolase family 97 protein [Prevotella sp. 10(H)]|uniref:glycoside hydrolase family 97 protein n=1 Tax=Prevotella sp. 10(H) TaxID=1158294 RepID=UPI0004A72C0C|nr:glycoside hydrolase family 97 protein [Prevotella sp. 10(H)]
MKNKYLILLFILFLSVPYSKAQENIVLTSPNGEISTSVKISDKIYYSVSYNGTELMKDNLLQLNLRGLNLGENPKLISEKRKKVNDDMTPVVPLKFSTVKNEYNQLLLVFKGDYSVEFRAFDDGVAYRFITNKKGDIEVMNEEVHFNFPDDYFLHLQQVWRTFGTPYEEPYTHLPLKEFNASSKMSTLPILIDTKKNYKILFAEAGLHDYPAMLIKGEDDLSVSGAFPRCPLKHEYKGGDRIVISQEADYMAKTTGQRTFPWRFFLITKEDGQLIENTMVCRLSESSQIEDTSWILPGQTVWDWWNYAMPYDVDFAAGRNQDTYKYFIDFAAESNIPYTLIDDGWANSRKEPFKANPNVNMPEVIEYANKKNIKIILWMHWSAIENNMDSIFRIYNQWGIAGVKIDFMERNDQWMVNFYERTAKEAAANKMIVLFHGSFSPKGLEYKYPNVLAYEAVRGLEWKGEATADNGIYLPFMRNAVGPMDYTPGAMMSMQPEFYANSDYNPAAIGTRAMQLAHFIVFESGMQMLADNPTRYNKEKECFDFITSVPVTWDETIALKAEVGEYVVVAKRKGQKWYIGAITNSKLKERNIEFDLSFLDKGRTYKLTSFEDGPNANYVAMDYKKRIVNLDAGKKVTIKLAKSGGWAAVLE